MRPMPATGPDYVTGVFTPHSIHRKAIDTTLRENPKTIYGPVIAGAQVPLTGSYLDTGEYNKFGSQRFHRTTPRVPQILYPRMPQYSQQNQGSTHKRLQINPGYVNSVPASPSAMSLLLRKGYLGAR